MNDTFSKASSIYGPAYEILVLITHAQKPPINTHADISRGAKGLNFGLNLHLHPFFVYVGSNGFCESVLLCRLVCVFVALHCDEYQNHMCWLICYKSSFFAVIGLQILCYKNLLFQCYKICITIF